MKAGYKAGIYFYKRTFTLLVLYSQFYPSIYYSVQVLILRYFPSQSATNEERKDNVKGEMENIQMRVQITESDEDQEDHTIQEVNERLLH